ncbi:MAG: glycosyltransferase family 2 protein [Bacteroidales bacterium]|nr:glycosyltransferase family 2 protein [Bacteroidales bacterium]
MYLQAKESTRPAFSYTCNPIKSKIIENIPKISVILPFYNAETTLRRAIESISNQSFTDFECLLIDNNSTDKSHAIAENQIKEDSRFKLISEKQQGVCFASNAGSKAAKGTYITRMDADDWAFGDRLKKQAEFLDNNPDYDVVSGLVEYHAHHDKTEGFARYVNWVNTITTDEQIKLNRFIESPIVNPTAMWRKICADQLGMYRNGDFPEDYELWLRWMDAGIRIHKLNLLVLRWYDSNERLTRTHPIYSDEAFYRIKTQYLEKFLTETNPHHPKVAIWGASKISRNRSKILSEYSIEVNCYIDIKKTRQLDKQIIYYEDLPNAGEIFILVYMKHIKIRHDICLFLQNRGYTEGIHFLLLS